MVLASYPYSSSNFKLWSFQFISAPLPGNDEMTKCGTLYHCKLEGVLFNLETDGGFYLIFWRQSRGVSKAMVWFSGSGIFGILSSKGVSRNP